MKILVRMGKSPFNTTNPEIIEKRNLIGDNSGNAIFQDATYKLLSSPDNEIVPYRFTPKVEDVSNINSKYDCFVMPFANAFRLSFKDALDKHTELIEKLNIPVIVLGIGVQASLECKDFSHLKPIEESVKRFCKAVLSKSNSIGVRGECTKTYLLSLGIDENNIDVIGCPSMFFNGNSLKINKVKIDSDSPISFNISPYIKNASELLLAVLENFSNITYIPQNRTDLRQMLYGHYSTKRKIDKYISNIFFKQGRALFFTSPIPWFDYFSNKHFSIGTRIHGTIAALISATPALLFVHDSRTKELAEYFEIPYLDINKIKFSDIDIFDIYEKLDFSGLVKNHTFRFNTLVKFLEKNGINDHIFLEKNKNFLEKFNKKFNKTLSNKVECLDFDTKYNLVERIKFLSDL